MPGWMKHKLESRLLEEISKPQKYRWHPVFVFLPNGRRASWWKWNRRVKKAGLKFNFQKTKIMASDLITSWQMIGKQYKQWLNLFWGPKITASGDCSHEIKRYLFLGRKVMTNLDSILKNRDIILPTKVCLVKAMVFPVSMSGCESWTIKKAERWRTLLNCGVGEDSWESLELQGDPTNPS